ncbi:MAG: hypothetical protein ACYC35_22285 [Pirellulales bacterium]
METTRAWRRLCWRAEQGGPFATSVHQARAQASIGPKVAASCRLSPFRTYEAIEIALDHTLGQLPEPQFTHEFR